MMVCRWQFHSNPDWAALSLDKVELIMINQACSQRVSPAPALCCHLGECGQSYKGTLIILILMIGIFP